MASGDRAFVGAVPELYDRLMGPMLFEPFALDLARRFAGFDGDLLETAAGTGRVTRALAAAVGPRGRITATDLNPPMLERAASMVRAQGIVWRQADAQALPFDDASFDAVVCQFGMMFLPDKAAGYNEARRVLRPGGRFVLSVWDDLAANDISQVLHETVVGQFVDNAPDFFARTPFGYHDKAAIAGALAQAGFGVVEIETVTLPTPATSAADAAMGLCTGTPLRGELEARGPDALAAAIEVTTRALVKVFGEGPFEGRGQALVVTARL